MSDRRLSTFLSLVLRHKPEAAGVTLDSNGWTDIGDLLLGAEAAGVPISPEALQRVVETNDKRRFEISPDGARIRARQGHSVPVDLGLAPAEPPATLYHGTVARALPAIRREGLRPMERHHVHLSPDRETAVRVGSRRGAPVILEVDAASLHARGAAFYLTTNGVWLTEAVPPEAIRFDAASPAA
ncbi:RNA 2'-phosphotransferase [Rubricoccus marinus]|uniref:Probable RNA 2'-phosphotransferase n=1 Tax=Rubricoccus marinus TaxID=716817 RepID=A0A259U1M2_9BACT|nr:RNA 2'-phosphotransferase [Rubricoccus marinus]OZC03889.1 RNA--NAD 2'-phosphotransferase [Rubricoccus marinus]